MYISVCGSSECDAEITKLAYEVGIEIARSGHVLVCGGLGGVMDAVSHGAHDGGGIAIGILPGPDRSHASRWLTVSLPTDMGHARNAFVALAADAIIAIAGGYGTLSEVAFGLKMGKPVVGLDTWELGKCQYEKLEIAPASTPREAVALASRLGSLSPPHSPDLGVN
ncbi:MAG: TIGR00725 family protein [Candidatus Anoxymicrobium japonicum]|uniref:TIGR00725 family protein n=1 Tax=Candidatus Anoxymicrobium japonicum TaxID=2013648 RepID=A0A2N3G7I8_9ACTN|nr:MAG: TIGR00725 family protein [Candidatus Anoxymicrobium japonicum]